MGNQNNFEKLEDCELSCYMAQLPIKIGMLDLVDYIIFSK
jgi:hypothetical protein